MGICKHVYAYAHIYTVYCLTDIIHVYMNMYMSIYLDWLAYITHVCMYMYMYMNIEASPIL